MEENERKLRVYRATHYEDAQGERDQTWVHATDRQDAAEYAGRLWKTVETIVEVDPKTGERIGNVFGPDGLDLHVAPQEPAARTRADLVAALEAAAGEYGAKRARAPTHLSAFPASAIAQVARAVDILLDAAKALYDWDAAVHPVPQTEPGAKGGP